MRAKIYLGFIAAGAAVMWWFRPAPDALLGSPPATVSQPVPVEPEPAPPPDPLPADTNAPARAVETVPASNAVSALNEHSLIGTTWGRNGFNVEFGPDGKLLIGGRERALWRSEGSRIRLYREDTGEEHWLDMASNRLMWEGKELGTVP